MISLLDGSEHKMPLRSIFRRGIGMVLKDIVRLRVKRNVIGYRYLNASAKWRFCLSHRQIDSFYAFMVKMSNASSYSIPV